MGRTGKPGGSLRLGDVVAAARVLRQGGGAGRDAGEATASAAEQRRTLAEFCRFALCGSGALGTPAVPSHAVTTEQRANGLAPVEGTPARGVTAAPAPPVAAPGTPPIMLDPRLPPRVRQTLEHLLRGDGEKQIAVKLGLSRHTVHVYVKTLHRHFNVCSRSELLARFISVPPWQPHSPLPDRAACASTMAQGQVS